MKTFKQLVEGLEESVEGIEETSLEDKLDSFLESKKLDISKIAFEVVGNNVKVFFNTKNMDDAEFKEFNSALSPFRIVLEKDKQGELLVSKNNFNSLK